MEELTQLVKDVVLQNFISLGLSAVGAIGTVVQANEISSLRSDVGEKATSTALTDALARITSLESTVNTLSATVTTLSSSGSSSATSLTSICTVVRIRNKTFYSVVFVYRNAYMNVYIRQYKAYNDIYY